MKKAYTFLFGSLALAACSDSNPSSATNNAPSSYDSGEGYTIAMPFQYDETTGTAYIGTSSCYYHADSKTFAWEESIEASSINSIKIIGDSLWLGPTSEDYDPEDYYYNYEKLALTTNHDGLYGTWELTGCTRVIGETEIKCDIYVNGLAGISQTYKITKDTIYTTFSYNPVTAKAFMDEHWQVPRIIDHYFLDESTNFYLDSLSFANNIKIIDNSKFSIKNQIFEHQWKFEFNKKGFGTTYSFTSNGKTCEYIDFMEGITENMCKEGNADILLSGRDKAFEEDYYEDGPIKEFLTSRNTKEFQECMQSLILPETKSFLNGQL